MNKGKPSGFKADTKKDAGAKSTSRPRRGQAGAGTGWTEREAAPATNRFDPALLDSAPKRDDATKPVNPFPEIRDGASTSNDGKSQLVHFEFTDGQARKVCIAGTFNDWHPEATEMISLGDGKWRKDLLLTAGEYEYRLVVDGRWITDPACREQRPNGLGENNSVLLVREL
jgi:hypothetical protein